MSAPRGTEPRPPADPRSGRERVLRAAYELFSRDGIRAVGIEAVIARANIAKMTLYRNFSSKEDLVLAFLERRERLWTHEWLERETERRAAEPARRLLAIFDVFGEWFASPGFDGCAFVRVLLETSDSDSAVRHESIRQLATIREFVRDLADGAGVADPDSLARQWHILMKGSIISAHEGDLQAAARAKEMGELLLRHHDVRL
ncbi:TetR/AcrR family transcriptional regulator [Amycolatopsis sp. H20-H5]|uniref:TetR/AcrR family transcriptional regulator n=1 Tax=Amycolatopsis sp. H20-H5 TaxID=3046309 RepID=UPI002DB77C18|nr:TetR/AcrR family transcriptional regulator [Amycolatopsis sp. H20-H5]MEC3976839.1 TetR/AcrR family transcriptional regulator [Amycolatopsis sp. H20-H5]